jgi:hypothetical protein
VWFAQHAEWIWPIWTMGRYKIILPPAAAASCDVRIVPPAQESDPIWPPWLGCTAEWLINSMHKYHLPTILVRYILYFSDWKRNLVCQFIYEIVVVFQAFWVVLSLPSTQQHHSCFFLLKKESLLVSFYLPGICLGQAMENLQASKPISCISFTSSWQEKIFVTFL